MMRYTAAQPPDGADAGAPPEKSISGFFVISMSNTPSFCQREITQTAGTARAPQSRMAEPGRTKLKTLKPTRKFPGSMNSVNFFGGVDPLPEQTA
jgi:hypothetical protein